MKVSVLINKLLKCHPNAEVVRSGSDHSYRIVRNADPTKAVLEAPGELSEYYDEEGVEVIDVVVIE
jgi:hypothetical protein